MGEQTIDLEVVKQVQQKVWSAGDFSEIAKGVSPVSERLCATIDILPGDRVLDVACGSGNTAIPAAKRAWGNTVGIDYVPELLERGRERAAAERVEVEFVEGDAENLPFEDGAFDVVLSTFGCMFAPDHQRTADEMLRVCRSGGLIGMANWVPDGYVGEMFKINSKHAPPPPGVQPPPLWGTEEHLRELFGDRAPEMQIERLSVPMAFFSADHWLETFKAYFGPVQMAFARVGDEGAAALEADLRDLLDRYNRAGERAMVIDAEYLQVIATRA
jgi:SAM-dependent methyltransferase